MKTLARLRHKRLQLAALTPFLLLVLVVPSFMFLTDTTHAAPRCECNTDYHCMSGGTCDTGAGCKPYEGFTGLCKYGPTPDCVETPIGCIPTDLGKARAYLFGIAVEIIGLLALIMFAVGGYQAMTSGDNPDVLAEGKAKMTAAVTGFFFLLLFIVIIRMIGIEILGITPLWDVI